MNVLGKVFVIANLIFSVVAASLIMVVYATRTNWHARYLEMENQAKLAKSNTDAYWELVNKTKVEEKKKLDTSENNLATALKEVRALTDKNNALQENLTKGTAAYDKLVQENSAIALVSKRLQEESELVRKQLAASNARNVEQEKEKATLRNRAVEAEIAAASQKERNELLLEENERVTKDLAKAKSAVASGGRTGGSGGNTKNPPLEDLDGVVEQSNPKDNLVTISLGSNHGLQKNHTLEVYRLGTDPKYLGTIRINDVRADKAVGSSIQRPLAPIQVGDRVASRIGGS